MKLAKTLFLRFCLVVGIGLFLSGVASAQNVIQGRVTDDSGEALPGATVLEKGTSNGTITDLEGNYQLAVGEDAVLVFTFIGFQTMEQNVQGRTRIDVRLNLDISELQEVVVIGYGVQQKKVATGSISRIGADNLDGYKVPSVEAALNGQVSGVIVSPSSGQPGSQSNILIRGISTNGDNSPLFIVDGMTVSEIDNINPADIESVDVLKDAASTAIYGARAANGVIIITTKKGKDGHKSISYEGFTSFSNPWKKPEMMNSQQYIEITREKFANANQLSTLDTRGFPQVGDQTNNTDWMDVIFDQATMINHRIGATLNNSYLSLEYWDQKGVIGGDKSNYKRYALRMNSDKQIADFLSIGQNFYINRTDNQNLGVNNAFGTLLADAFAYDPLTGVYDENAQYGFAQSPWVQKEYINPMSRLFITNNSGHADQVQGNAFLKIKPIKNLTLTSDLGVDFNWFNYRTFTPDYAFHDAFKNVNNSVAQGYGFGQRIQFENYATYDQNFGNHSLNVVVGASNITSQYEDAGGSTLNIPDAVKFNRQFHYVSAGQDTSDLSYGIAAVDYKLLSYYGRVLYDFKNKYLFSFTLRRDASSRFGANNRQAWFPSMSAGWVVSDENFFNVGPVSFLKLRGSWGVNGNDRIGDLAYMARVANAFSYGLGSEHALNQGSSLTTLPNPNLKWEESVQLDIGLELKLFDDKLATEFDYYVKTTKDLLGAQIVPGYLGVLDFPISNLGEIQNRGLEASASYRLQLGDFRLNTTVNYTTFKNETVEVPGTSTFIEGWGWPVRNVSITRLSEGEPVAHFMGLKTLGIFQKQNEVFSHISREGDVLQPNAAPGDLIFEDTNKDGQINNDDFTSIGSPWPDHIIGLNFSGGFRGFDFNVLFSSQLGHEIYRTYERTDIPYSNYQTFWMDRWTESNPGHDLPRLVQGDPNGNQRPSDFYVEDGSFLRLRNVQIGYNIPSQLLETIHLKGLRIYLSANNLFTLTGYRGFDPEIGTNNNWILDTGIDKGYYPSNKTIGGGIRITM